MLDDDLVDIVGIQQRGTSNSALLDLREDILRAREEKEEEKIKNEEIFQINKYLKKLQKELPTDPAGIYLELLMFKDDKLLEGFSSDSFDQLEWKNFYAETCDLNDELWQEAGKIAPIHRRNAEIEYQRMHQEIRDEANRIKQRELEYAENLRLANIGLIRLYGFILVTIIAIILAVVTVTATGFIFGSIVWLLWATLGNGVYFSVVKISPKDFFKTSKSVWGWSGYMFLSYLATITIVTLVLN